MDSFSKAILETCKPYIARLHAWCVLPNHYHLLVTTSDVDGLLGELGRLHGRTSYEWNGEEDSRGRKVFYRSAERAMRSERHYFATLNYVHHNPVHHKYVSRWHEWPWGSAAEFLARVERDEAERIWREYPLNDYGRGWDEVEM
jgi:putative transposase